MAPSSRHFAAHRYDQSTEVYSSLRSPGLEVSEYFGGDQLGRFFSFLGFGGRGGHGVSLGGGGEAGTRCRSHRAKAAATAVFLTLLAGYVYVEQVRSRFYSDQIGDNLPIVSSDGKFNGRYPNSLLTLFYPYTLFRDVVLDQPIPDSDVAFFWHVHKSDERIVKEVLTSCFGLDLVELNDIKSIKQAIDVGLVSVLTRRHVITSPFIREAAEVFTMENFGRMFAVWRHPIDYDIHPSLPTFVRSDNWMVRLLSDKHDSELGFKELGIAKQVVRQTTVVATIDKFADSIVRIAEYFGWEYVKGKDELCINDIVNEHNIKETFVDHDSKQWRDFYESNRYDCQLYEVAQSAWRAQIQTVIPYKLQLQRAEPEKEESEEKGE